jgi:integrase
MSSYFVEKKGWRYDAVIKGTRITGTWFRSKEEALEAQGIRKEEIRKGIPKPETPTDTDFLTLCRVRLDFLQAHKTERYYTENKVFLKRMLKKWGNPMCSQISEKKVSDYVTSRPTALVGKKGKPGNGTNRHAVANYELRMLRAALQFGIEKKRISSDPTANVDFLPKTEKPKRYIPPAEDISKLLEVAKRPAKRKTEKAKEAARLNALTVYSYLVVLILTLARVGEINRLEWTDVNFSQRFLVLYTRKKKGGNLTGRQIPMTDLLYHVLWHLFQLKDPSVSWVFSHRYWSVREGRFVTGPFKDRKKLMSTLCRQAKIKYFRYHSLRHFGASTMASSGVPLVDIQKLLGHESIDTTQKYIQSLTGGDRRAIETYGRTIEPHMIHTQQINQGASPEANPLILLVGRTGIEPATR